MKHYYDVTIIPPSRRESAFFYVELAEEAEEDAGVDHRNSLLLSIFAKRPRYLEAPNLHGHPLQSRVAERVGKRTSFHPW